MKTKQATTFAVTVFTDFVREKTVEKNDLSPIEIGDLNNSLLVDLPMLGIKWFFSIEMRHMMY